MRRRDRDVNKLEVKALEGKFVGYTEWDNGYLVYVPNTRKVAAVRDLIIKESEVGLIRDNTETPYLLDEESQQLLIWHPDNGHQDDGNKEEQGTSTEKQEEWHYAESVNTQETTLRRDASDVEEAALDEDSTATRGSLRDSVPLEDSETEDFSQTVGFFEEALEQVDRAESRRSTPARKVPQFFGEVRTHLAVTEGDYMEPSTVYEAKQGDDWDQLHRAMEDEVQAFQDNEIWNLVRPPTDRDVIQGKWVYEVKLRYSGQVDKYKARYVAKGVKHVERLDNLETFAPTCKPETFRILLQLSAKQGHVKHQFDVKTAFLHSPKKEEVYLEQPLEFAKQESDGEKLVCRLNKSIYGLKQATNNWYKGLENFLQRQGFTRSRNDHCLFARAETEGNAIILVWIDDIIVASRSMTLISDVKKAPETTIHMENRGRLHWFLGLRIRREEVKVTVDQELYMKTMLQRFPMDQCKPSRTLADLNLKLQTAQKEDEEVDQRIYWSLVGSFLYLAKQTRPDIMFTVNILSRHLNAPTNQHLRYLQGSKGLKLAYTKGAGYDLVGENDADWSGDLIDRKSTKGYYFKLNGRGAALSWVVKKQATVALSSSEAKYQGLAPAVQEELYLKQLLEDFGIQQKHPIAIGEDNQSCIKLCQNPVIHKTSKHIETKFHFIRDKTDDGTNLIHYVPTDKMAAVIFTKSLPVSKVKTFKTVLMGTDSTQSAQVWVGVLEYRSNYSLKLSEN